MVGVSGSKLGKARSGVARLDGNGGWGFRRGLAMVCGYACRWNLILWVGSRSGFWVFVG